MNLKKVKQIILLLSIIIMALTRTISTAVSSYPAGVGISAGWPAGIYCTQHEATLSPSVTYGQATNINYASSGTEEADIIVAYALYLGLTGEELQKVIWASSNNKGVHEELTNEEVKEYKKVYDEIFSKAGENLVTHTEKEDNVKVLVDRPNGTYMVGPYKLDLTVKASAEAKRMLLKEIKTGSEGKAGCYAVFSGISGINGEIQQLVYSDGSVVASENGLKYGFPDFGKEFYIKFKPNQEGAIVSTGKPNFKLNFLRNVTGTITNFDATSIDYELDLAQYEQVKIAKAKGKVNFPNPPSTGPSSSVHTQTQTVNVDLTIEVRHNNGNLLATETKSEQVKFERKYSYDDNGNLATVGGKKVTWTSSTSSSGSVQVSHTGNQENDVQTLANASGGKPEWVKDIDKKSEVEVPPFEYSINQGEGYTYQADQSTEPGITLPDAKIDMQIGGNVWLEDGELKTGEYNGRKDEEEKPFAGMQVDLYQSDGTLVTTTTTDKDGKYRFYGIVTYPSDNENEAKGLPKYPGGINFTEEGQYSLINPLKQYYVVFEYDGQRYQATYSYSNIAQPGGYSNAREIGREEYNAKFKTIYSSPNNYDNAKIELTGATGEIATQKRAYAIDHKIAKDDGEYAVKEGDVALTYEDVYNKFLELSTSADFGEPKIGDYGMEWKQRQNNYYLSIDELKAWLAEKGVNSEFERIQSFIFDTLIKSSTQKDNNGNDVLYPKYERFVVKELYNTESNEYTKTHTITVGDKYTYLYSSNYDMARYVDFGICRRLKADIRLQKDLYKTTLIVNGKKEVYEYDKRDLSEESEFWDIRVRASDALYNGTTAYTRDVRASEYLLGEEDVGAIKTLKAYVTYKIAFKNAGESNVIVKEIVDHYDAEGYTFDRSDPIINENTFIGDYEGNKTRDLSTSTSGIRGEGESTIGSDKYRYNNLYLTGMDELLTPGNVSWVYVTFRVQNDEKGKIKLDYLTDPYTTNKDELQVSVGKKNIAEINAYETYYVNSNGITEIPDYLEDGSNTVNLNVAGKIAGLIDYDSNPGSLSILDLDEEGNLKITKTETTITGKDGLLASDRQEDDSSQAPNIRLIIDNNDDEIRRLKGYVFEDSRTEKSIDATIGNGEYDEGETKINGVKVELVEIIPDVDESGISTHSYSTEEKVWESYTYDVNSNQLVVTDDSRYSSGDGRTKIVINGPAGTIFEVLDTENLQYNDGEYTFKSLPAGDFYIRFVYGDNDDNTLVNTEKLTEKISELEARINELSEKQLSDEEKITLRQLETEKQRTELNYQVNSIIGVENGGRNAKSYNGQDYKSTTYQVGLNQGGDYYGIKGYTNYEGQNYTKADGTLNNGTDKESMYYYDIFEGDSKENVSDAKDVWYYRDNSNNYSKGADGKILLNNRAELLSSFEKPVSYAPSIDEIKDDGTSYGYTQNGEKVYDTSNEYYKNKQRTMINEFENNTKVTAQTGIINTEIEMDRNETVYDLNESTRDTRTLKYTVSNIDFGLVERPKAQLMLNKEVSNYQLALYTGQILFDAQKSVNNLSYSGHVKHSALKDSLGLFMNGEPRVGRPGFGESEIIQNYVDNENLNNSIIIVEYNYFVENVGETDYKDKQFYYTGVENEPDANISKTSAVAVVDYVANTLDFSTEIDPRWVATSVQSLTPSVDGSNEDANFINRLYYPELNTYKTIITTEQFGDEIKPGERKDGKLTLSSHATDTQVDKKVYCNMTEIIATSNDLGRRCVYSIPGNEEMADQNLGDNAASGAKTSMNRILVNEIDADSSQEIKILPPLGTETGVKVNATGLNIIRNLMSEGITSIKNRLLK